MPVGKVHGHLDITLNGFISFHMTWAGWGPHRDCLKSSVLDGGQHRMSDAFKYVDVHCHLDDDSFDNDRDEVVRRARDILILCAGQEPSSSRKVLSLARIYPNVRACLGIHPEFVPNLEDREIEDEIGFIGRSADRIVAISEIGLDYHWIKDEVQMRRTRDVFHMMLDLAARLRLPIIVHSRDALT